MADAQWFQPLVMALMRTLLVDYPTLLDESDTSSLADVKACQRMGLKISYPVLAAEGHSYDPKRFYVGKLGNWYLCSQWQLPNHRSNAERLLNFVEDLIKRNTTHPDVSQLDRHREAFKKCLGSPAPAGQLPAPPPPPPADQRPTRAIDHPRNQILYGPPGTGKTYSTVDHSLTIISSGGTGDAGIKNLVAELGEERVQTVLATLHRSFVSEGRIAMVTFHQNYAYEDFVEGIRPRLADANGGDQTGDSAGTQGSQGIGYELRPGIFRKICRAAEEERRAAKDESRTPERFVLIIDEINRGNIPKIFGELITLIEESRRLGGPDETTVTLPYSGDDFGVPENLYIVGTMNTADRSIQQLDTALRRRFTFVEMMPDPDHELVPEDVDGVNCRKMLRAMNERIVLLMDREHQIGHTYLLDVKSIEDLADRFRNRIFPLLQEYFYDDWRRIDAVLGGNAFVQPTRIGEGYAKDLAREFDLVDEEMVTYERLPEHDRAWEDAGQYRKIYEPAAAD